MRESHVMPLLPGIFSSVQQRCAKTAKQPDGPQRSPLAGTVMLANPNTYWLATVSNALLSSADLGIPGMTLALIHQCPRKGFDQISRAAFFSHAALLHHLCHIVDAPNFCPRQLLAMCAACWASRSSHSHVAVTQVCLTDHSMHLSRLRLRPNTAWTPHHRFPAVCFLHLRLYVRWIIDPQYHVYTMYVGRQSLRLSKSSAEYQSSQWLVCCICNYSR
jgi:hypothetical protein